MNDTFIAFVVVPQVTEKPSFWTMKCAVAVAVSFGHAGGWELVVVLFDSLPLQPPSATSKDTRGGADLRRSLIFIESTRTRRLGDPTSLFAVSRCGRRSIPSREQ